jgi:hypothetical protein
MNMRAALVLSGLLSLAPLSSAFAQTQPPAGNPVLQGYVATTTYVPLNVVRVVYLPSPYSDAMDTLDATRNQYAAGDVFQQMAIGF